MVWCVVLICIHNSRCMYIPSVRLLDVFIEFLRRRSPSVANQLLILWLPLVNELKVLLLCKTLISMVTVKISTRILIVQPPTPQLRTGAVGRDYTVPSLPTADRNFTRRRSCSGRYVAAPQTAITVILSVYHLLQHTMPRRL